MTCFGPCVSAAAAARAGLTRFRPLAQTQVMDEASGEMVPLIGAIAVTGFEGVGRIVRLAVGAIDDLKASYSFEEWAWARTGVFFALTVPPDSLFTKPASREIRFETGFSSADNWAQTVVERVIKHTNLHDRAACRSVFIDERRGTIRALQQAIADIDNRQIDTALIVAADSCIDLGRLNHYLKQRRLKTPNNPVGLIPGEAAVALLLSRISSHTRARALANLYQPLVEFELPTQGHSSSGRALLAALTAAQTRVGKHFGTMYGDLNGEEARAVDLGAAMATMSVESPLRHCNQVFPATTFGETGAAGPLVAVSLAARGFARGYARGEAGAVFVAAEDGTRAAFAVERSI
jgi:3-oxoacyl-[acyl-carrier-protein] synthase-1